MKERKREYQRNIYPCYNDEVLSVPSPEKTEGAKINSSIIWYSKMFRVGEKTIVFFLTFLNDELWEAAQSFLNKPHFKHASSLEESSERLGLPLVSKKAF